MSEVTDIESPSDQLRPAALVAGSAVEVQDRFRGEWARGFEVAAVLEHGYQIRRLSDGSLLPGEFAFSQVRRERRRRGTWWY